MVVVTFIDGREDSIDLATLTVKPILSGGVNTYPSPSPDGARIAFRRMPPENNSEVFVAASDGTQVRNLTNHPAFDGWPDWSPDGRRIASTSKRGGDHKIYLMNPDGSGVQLPADTPGRGTAPR
jgi:TolB protein